MVQRFALPIKAFKKTAAISKAKVNCLFFFSSSTSSLNHKLPLGSSISRLKINCSFKPSFPAIHRDGLADLLLYTFQKKELHCKRLQYVQNDFNCIFHAFSIWKVVISSNRMLKSNAISSLSIKSLTQGPILHYIIYLTSSNIKEVIKKI